MTSPCAHLMRHHARQAGRALARGDAAMAEAWRRRRAGTLTLDEGRDLTMRALDEAITGDNHDRTARAWARGCSLTRKETP